MVKLAKFFLIGSVLWLFFSCTKSENYTSSVIAQSDRTVSNYESTRNQPENYTLPDDPAQKRFLIPPEIAVMQATIQVQGNSFAEVASLIDTNSNKFITSITKVKGCNVEIIDYQHPRESYPQKSLNDNTIYNGNLKLTMTISFTNNNTVGERIKQLNSCLQAIPKFTLETIPKNTNLKLILSEVIPTVNNLETYRQQLLEAKFSQLQEINNLTQTPSQFNLQDTKCTSNGKINIVNRTLSNIELDIDFNCIQFNQLKE